MDLLNWLENESRFPKIYFERPADNYVVAGVGAKQVWDEIPEDPPGMVFGGQDFFSGRARYILPEEMREGEITEEFEKSFEAPLSRVDKPDKARWMEAALSITLPKVVLARETEFTFENELNPIDIVRALRKAGVRGTLFAFIFEKGRAFVGGTPEILYKREGREVESVAIAGTRPAKASKGELLKSLKDQAEVKWVEQFVEDELSPLCESLERGKREITRTPYVQHLMRRFKGKLKEGIGDRELVKKLHPTPALGGFPREEALMVIGSVEPFRRGWYGAPVGWISKERSCLSVAIRSARVEGRRLFVYAGAGIVEGSVPEKEWDELEQKIKQYILW